MTLLYKGYHITLPLTCYKALEAESPVLRKRKLHETFTEIIGNDVIVSLNPPWEMPRIICVLALRFLVAPKLWPMMGIRGDKLRHFILMSDYLQVNVFPLLITEAFAKGGQGQGPVCRCLGSMIQVLGMGHPFTVDCVSAVSFLFGEHVLCLYQGEYSYRALKRGLRDFYRAQVLALKFANDKVKSHFCKFCFQDVLYLFTGQFSCNNVLLLPCCAGILHKTVECAIQYCNLQNCHVCQIPLYDGKPDYECESLHSALGRYNLRSGTQIPFVRASILPHVCSYFSIEDAMTP